MRKAVLLTVLLFAAPAGAVLPPPSEGFPTDELVSEARGAASAPDQPSRIYAVQGPELKSRLSTALSHAHGLTPRTDFWAGYLFEVCVEVDSEESRKVVVLLRYGRDGDVPSRVEVRGPERPRGEAGVPFYWLGRATSSESLGVLGTLLKDVRADHDAAELTRAVGLLGGGDVVVLLRDLTRRSPSALVRARAAVALLRHPAQAGFVAGIVLDPAEPEDVRRAAAEGLAASRDADARALLLTVYAKSADPEVRRLVKEALPGKGAEVASWPRSSRGETLSTLKPGGSSPAHGPQDHPR